MAILYDDFRCFTVHDLKKHGMLQSGFFYSLVWLSGGEKTASIGIITKLVDDDPHLTLYYTCSDGEMVYDRVNMLFVKSNLGRRGYWHFVCPYTGKPCRKLYLHNKHFKSRAALPPEIRYKSQTITSGRRTMSQYFTALDKVEALHIDTQKPYTKKKYRGAMTRNTERNERWSERCLLYTYRFLAGL